MQFWSGFYETTWAGYGQSAALTVARSTSSSTGLCGRPPITIVERATAEGIREVAEAVETPGGIRRIRRCNRPFGTAAPPPPYGSATNRSAVRPERPSYPRPTPAPPTYSSPTAPTGTGSPAASSTYTRVFAIGPPTATLASVSPAAQSSAVAASDGP